jgi:hexulose-6-phosphate isomerase
MGLTNKIGIMQGRLSPQLGNRIQAFPLDNWREEFVTAKEIGYNSIEWIVESPLELNPLLNFSGIEEINNCISSTGVKVDYVCADIFMENPIFEEENLENNLEILTNIITFGNKIGAKCVEIPFVDNSSLKKNLKNKNISLQIKEVIPIANDLGMQISLETDLEPKEFREFLLNFESDAIRANYDIGNSASLGFDTREEISMIGEFITNVHIKDRKFLGSTVPLGSGNANIPLALNLLSEIDYKGGITMQAAREVDNLSNAKKQLAQVNKYLAQIE